MEDNVRDGKFTTFEPTHSDVNCEVCRGKVETKNANFTTVLSIFNLRSCSCDNYIFIYIYIYIYTYTDWIQNVSSAQNQTIL